MLTPDLRLQVTYPLWVGSLLHSVPLLLILASLGAKACRQSRAPGAQHFSSALLDGKGPPAGGQPPLLQAALPLLQEVRPQDLFTNRASACAASECSALLQGSSEHQFNKQSRVVAHGTGAQMNCAAAGETMAAHSCRSRPD